ncbi:MAG: glycerol-3-phosphate 1-O-acyltransferase PlsY [Candidatus Omnitrophota bacterium]|jgi:glycerol-3-phosphate acyltransferase PlsY
MDIAFYIAFIPAVLSAYLIGAIPTGYIMARIFKGVDIRQFGSSNMGATNVYRVVGKLPGFVTLVLDALKGVLVVAVIAVYTYSFVDTLDYNFYRSLLGLIAICGHIWPVFLGFKGGKGVATTIGVLSIIAPIPLILSLLIWLIIFLLTSYVSLASIIFGIFLPIFSAVLNESIYITIFTVTICIINTYKHDSNIKRLLKGEENKTILGKKGAK